MRARRVWSALSVSVAVAALSFGVAGSSPAQASITRSQLSVAQSQVVSAFPSTTTPNIDGGVVYTIAQAGTWIVAGGSFTSATAPGSATAVSDTGVVAFDQGNGAIDTAFVPSLNGVVNSVIAGPMPNTVFIGGAFTTVNGVKSLGVTLLSLGTGKVITGFKEPVLNGAVFSMRLSAGRLYLAGSFTTVNGVAHGGVATVNAASGALDSYLTVQLTGHHNYNGKTGYASGPVGARAVDISPNGTRAIVLGNFKDANGALHDQILMLDLTSTSAVIDPHWNTSSFTAACLYSHFDSYVSDVSFSPDGTYFAIADTGAGSTSLNTDGTRSLCDAASRWSTTDTGTDVQPTWVDYTGNDTFWSVAVTGTAVYLGGHARWVNNPSGPNNSAAGAVARPGLVALDPISGLPLAWNPGRNPRGAGAYALLATSAGLYVGSDQNYFGDYRYKRDEIGFFPLVGGYVPASTATTVLPANVYEAGPTNSTTSGVDDLAWRSYSSAAIGAQTTVANTGVPWSTARGVFMIGATIYYGTADGNFYRASFNGQTVGPPVVLDPYDDPAWDNVQTGSGQTYQGVKPGYYGEIPSITGAFYSAGRLYYAQSGVTALHWRYFSPDSGTIGSTEFAVTGGSFAKIAGMFASGTTLYYATSTDASLHAVTYTDGGTNGLTPTVTPTTDHILSGPSLDGRDWRAQGMFAFNPPTPPVARATTSCTNLGCTFDGSASTAPSGTIASYGWSFADGTTSTGAVTTRGYANAGTYTYSLSVTDNQGLVSAPVTGTVTVAASSTPIGFNASADATTAFDVGVTMTTPISVNAGDTEVIYVATSNVASNVLSVPSGWTQVATQTNLPLQAALFEKTATGTEPGSAVTVSVTSAGPITAQLLDYTNVASAAPVTAGAADVSAATHTTPAIGVTAAGSWVVSFWSDKSSTTSAWTLPSGVTQRDQAIGTGPGRVTAALGDTNGPVATGTYPTQSASVGATPSGRAAMISLVLTPSG